MILADSTDLFSEEVAFGAKEGGEERKGETLLHYNVFFVISTIL